jgi:hypothetical protein
MLPFLSEGGRHVRPWYSGHWVEVGLLALEMVNHPMPFTYRLSRAVNLLEVRITPLTRDGCARRRVVFWPAVVAWSGKRDTLDQRITGQEIEDFPCDRGGPISVSREDFALACRC